MWGAAGFDLPSSEAEAIGALFDAEGRACLVDDRGISCFDDDGEEAWGLPVEGGIVDVVAGEGAWALYTEDGVLIVDDGTGDLLDELDGVVGVSASGRMVTLDAEGLGEPGAGLVAVDDEVLDALELLVAEDGRVGALDPDGGLTWIGADGTLGERLDLELAADGGLRAVALGDGFAILDDEGLVLLDQAGEIHAELDVRGRDLVLAGDELWVATEEGVVAVDPDEGVFLDGLVAPGNVRALAVVDDGDAMALLEVGARSLRVFDEAGPLHGDGHRQPVARVTPAADGGAVSVDEGGTALWWSSEGVPRVLGRDVHDVAWDGAGRLWIAGEEAIRVQDADGGLPDVALRADWLVGISDGVLAGDGQVLVRLAPDGTEVWRMEGVHAGRAQVGEGVVVLPSDGSLVVLDLETGARRRRLLPVAGAEGSSNGLHAGGVAIGGLVVVGELDGLAGAWRPPVPRTLRSLVTDPAGVPSLAPNGRWVAWPDGERLVVAETGGGPVFASRPGAGVSTLATDDERVFVGRIDGSVERWTVHDVVVDAPLPRFNGYAQLDVFHPVPEGPPAIGYLVRSGAIVDLAARADGALAIAAGGVSWLEPAADTTHFTDDVSSKHIVVVDPPMVPTAVAWDDGTRVIGSLDGRVVAEDEDGTTPLYQGQGPISSLCRTGERWVLGTAGGVRILDSEGGAHPLSGMPGAPVEALACGPDGAWVAAAHQGRIFLWLQAADGARMLTQGGPVRSLAALPDGSLVSGGDDEVAVVWDPGTWTPTYVLEGHGAPVVDLVVDPSQQRMVAAAGDGAVVWNLAGLFPEGRLMADGPVTRVAMDGEARQVWLGGVEGRVHAFRLPRLDAALPPALEPGIPTRP